MRKIYIGIGIAGLIVSCSPKTTGVVSDVEASVEMPANIMEGKNLYVNNCGKCHKLKNIDSYSRAQWDKVLHPMVVKSKLTDDDEAKINNYVNWELEH